MDLVFQSLLVLGIIGGALALYAFIVEPAWLRVRRRILYLDSWNELLDGLTILHLSDLHIGRSNGRLVRFLRAADTIEADVVVITGDFVHRPEDVRHVQRVMSALQSHPVVLGVPGNHDWYEYSTRWPGIKGRPFDSSPVLEALGAAGVTMLLDSSRTVSARKSAATLVGVGLTYGPRERLKKILGENADLGSVVLLAHSPDVLHEAAANSVPLVLCGHTHGGQIRVGPWFTPTTATRLPLERPYGVIAKGNTLMHVSPGLGTTFLPARFFARPEVTLLELRSAGSRKGPAE